MCCSLILQRCISSDYCIMYLVSVFRGLCVKVHLPVGGIFCCWLVSQYLWEGSWTATELLAMYGSSVSLLNLGRKLWAVEVWKLWVLFKFSSCSIHQNYIVLSLISCPVILFFLVFRYISICCPNIAALSTSRVRRLEVSVTFAYWQGCDVWPD